MVVIMKKCWGGIVVDLQACVLGHQRGTRGKVAAYEKRKERLTLQYGNFLAVRNGNQV